MPKGYTHPKFIAPPPPNIPTDIFVIQIGPENDPNGLIKERYNMRKGTTYLFHPDQHIAARTHQVSQVARMA